VREVVFKPAKTGGYGTKSHYEKDKVFGPVKTESYGQFSKPVRGKVFESAKQLVTAQRLNL
jgi:hypothetical protein